MENINNSPDYWEGILEKEGLGNIDYEEFNFSDNVIDILDGTMYDIDDIKNNINIKIEDDIINFYYGDQIIGFINYFLNGSNKVFLEFIGNKNAKESDLVELDEGNYRVRYTNKLGNSDNNFNVKGLGYYMFKKFIETIRQKYGSISEIGLYVNNSNIYSIVDKLERNDEIKSYEDNNRSLKLYI